MVRSGAGQRYGLVVPVVKAASRYGNDSGFIRLWSDASREAALDVRRANMSPDQSVAALTIGAKLKVTPEEYKDILTSPILANHPNPINFHNLTITGQGNGNLFGSATTELGREDMPVVPASHASVSSFAQTLKDAGIQSREEDVDPRTLIATQNELDGRKVAALIPRLQAERGTNPDKGTLVVSKEGSILDGHHRWGAAASIAMEDPTFKSHVLRVDAPIGKLLELTHAYNDAKGLQPHEFGQFTAGGLFNPMNLGIPEGEHPPDPNKPYLYHNGHWLLLATDAEDNKELKLTGWTQEARDAALATRRAKTQVENYPHAVPGVTQTPLQAFANKAAPVDEEAVDLEHYQQGWMAGLHTDQKSALEDYTTVGYHDINATLRGVTIDPYDSSMSVAETKAEIPKIDAALASVPPLSGPVTVYRGISGDIGLKEGVVIGDKGFVSTTLNPAVVPTFAGDDKNTFLAITLPKGSQAAYMGPVSVHHEDEVLLPRDSSFRVTKVTSDSDGNKFAEAELVSNGTKAK